jgi:hypothetical protein
MQGSRDVPSSTTANLGLGVCHARGEIFDLLLGVLLLGLGLPELPIEARQLVLQGNHLIRPLAADRLPKQ